MSAEMPGLDDTEQPDSTATDPQQDLDTTPADAESSTESSSPPAEPVESPTDTASEAAAEVETPPTPVDEPEPTAEPLPAEGEAEAPPQPVSSNDAESAEGPEPSEQPAAEGANAQPATPPKPPSRFKRGDIVEGTVTETTPTSIGVDLGEGDEGIIPGRELERMTKQMIEELVEGATLSLYVVNPSDHRGKVVLSINRALEEMDWREAEDYQNSRTVYESVIAGYNKGGLIVRFGRLRGFVPQSQISDDRRRAVSGETPEERWGGMVKEPIGVKVIEVDRGRNRLILSERAAARETREARKARLIEELTLHEIREGRVVSLEDFGAFVDIGGAEGLVHLTELSWGHVTHPRQVVKVGDVVKVEVISVDPKRKRIGLSMKSQLADPWDEIATGYAQGQLVQAQVTKLTKFGAFAQLMDAPEVEGLIHISELSNERVAHPREVVNVGETLTLRIVKIDMENRRLGLSLKAVNSTEYLDDDFNRLFGDTE